MDRLDDATSAGIWGGVIDWAYDGVGNRQRENATAYTYLPGTNKLNTVGGVAFGFDGNGNTVAEGARVFGYNDNQRLVRVTDGGVTKGEYTYNGNGQRVKKVAAGVTTVYHFSLMGQLIAESDASGSITAEYVYLNGQPLAKMEGANTYYYHNDHLGTPQKMTDSSGTVVWAGDYKPFGEATITTGTITNNLRFPGQYYDAETGLHYNYYRDYNPVIGKYIEADPIGIRMGENHLYVGVGNNPVNSTDPWGLQATSSGTGTCPLPKKSCKDQADDIYNQCVSDMNRGPGLMGMVPCVARSILTGIAVGGGAAILARNVNASAVGGIVGGIGIVSCIAGVAPSTGTSTAHGLCFRQAYVDFLRNCQADE